jgi:hypothetical protein
MEDADVATAGWRASPGAVCPVYDFLDEDKEEGTKSTDFMEEEEEEEVEDEIKILKKPPQQDINIKRQGGKR